MSSQPRSILFLHPVALDHRAGEWVDLPSVIAPTLPGHGSRARRPGIRLDDMVDEIVGWVSAPVHVVGCSLGGMLAMRLALRHPELVSSLVLGFTTARIPRQVMLDRADETEQCPVDELADETLRRWFSGEELARGEASSAVAYARGRLLATDPFAIADTWRAIAEHDVLDDLSALAMPVTCIAGDADVSTPLPAVETIAAAIPGAELVVMDGPHMGFLESPEVFTAIVRRHMAQASRG